MNWEPKPWKRPPPSGQKKGGYQGASIACPGCHQSAKFVNRREKTFLSLLGELRLSRCYYHCRCGHSVFPWDHTLHLDTSARLTPAAQEVTCIVAVKASFAESSERTLHKVCGLRLSESTVERVTEAAGERIGAALRAKQTFGDEQSWDWHHDARGKTCAYVSVDATSIRQQGEHGAKAEGRMAYVGMVYNPRGAAQTLERRKASTPHQVRYLAGFYALDDLGLELRRQAAQVGWDDAEQQIALSDGGAGLEDFFRKNFPLAVCILDFWHAKEYLVELAHALHGDASAEGAAWLDEQCHQLKHAGGAAVRAQLEVLDVSQHSAAAQELHRCTTNYFRNHQHRMDYPTYIANGWEIGSGPVESACKTVINNRLDGSGMRWGPSGSDALCHLRALYLSEPNQWEAYWHLPI
jgi:Uncharacterised protein family (UPF0236)